MFAARVIQQASSRDAIHKCLNQTIIKDAQQRGVQQLRCDSCAKTHDLSIIGQPCECGCWDLTEVFHAE